MDRLTLNQYVPLALRTEKPLPTVLDRLRHAALGLITEPGEFTTCVKRVAIYGKDIDAPDEKDPKKLTLRDHMAEEIGDAMWYIAIGCDALNANLFAFTASHNGVPAQPVDDLALDLAGLFGRFATVVVQARRLGTLHQDARDFLVNTLDSMVATLHAICFALDLDLGDLMAENIVKLQERFPDAYSNEAAEARADKGGLDARNS